jgi:hypothetical protein
VSRRLAVGLWLWLGLVPAPVVAEEPVTDSATISSAPAGFVPIRGKNRAAKTAAGPLVVGAYAAVLAGLFGYVVYVVRSQSTLAQRLNELERRLRREDP